MSEDNIVPFPLIAQHEVIDKFELPFELRNPSILVIKSVDIIPQ